jgi:hypothetical protein
MPSGESCPFGSTSENTPRLAAKAPISARSSSREVLLCQSQLSLQARCGSGLWCIDQPSVPRPKPAIPASMSGRKLDCDVIVKRASSLPGSAHTPAASGRTLSIPGSAGTPSESENSNSDQRVPFLESAVLSVARIDVGTAPPSNCALAPDLSDTPCLVGYAHLSASRIQTEPSRR